MMETKPDGVVKLEKELNMVFMCDCGNDDAWDVCEGYRKKYGDEFVECRAESFDPVTGKNRGGIGGWCSVYVDRDRFEAFQLKDCMNAIFTAIGGVK